jgi:hypothetical protein
MERAKRRLGDMIDFYGRAEQKFGGEGQRERRQRAVTEGDGAALDVLGAVMNLVYHEGAEESKAGQEWVASAISLLQHHAEYLDERAVEIEHGVALTITRYGEMVQAGRRAMYATTFDAIVAVVQQLVAQHELSASVAHTVPHIAARRLAGKLARV